MRYLSLCIFCSLFVWLAGCASTKPDQNPNPATKKITYETNLKATNFDFSGNGLTKPAEIQYKIYAQCKGQNCVPEKAELAFYLEPGPNTVYLSDRNLSIHAGDKTYTWQGNYWQNIYDSPPVLGLIKKVTLKWNELKQIAETEEINGSLSGQNFEWNYENREPIRSMLAKIKSSEVKED